jgi:hypothetical protein
MQVAVWIVLAAIVAFVVIDACTRGNGTPGKRTDHHGDRADQAVVSTQKIIVDLTKRR